jgi:S-methylmethionine-dependent homocysteine/selenocysteine methylase
MTRYRHSLPQLRGDLFLTDGGIETTLVFDQGFDLLHFASFDLLRDRHGEGVLRNCYSKYAEVARRYGTGLIIESPTWRASADWGEKLGYTREALAEANRNGVRLMEELRREFEAGETRIVVSGNIGPRGDGYIATNAMNDREAQDYHREQIETLATTDADMLCAMTINYAAEAVGIARAAQAAWMPVVIAFTVETDGRLPDGMPLDAAIDEVDRATSSYPLYYMINCAHPSHFDHVLTDGESVRRIRGIRANSSCKSHAELNECSEIDRGNPQELGAMYAGLKRRLPQLNVLGGCCGTDHRHIEEIAAACAPLFGLERRTRAA